MTPRLLSKASILAAGVVLILIGLRLAPKPALHEQVPSSTALYAQDGSLLRLTLAPDQQYRLWVPLQNLSPAMVDAVLLYEDRAYAWHPGINPWALARSAWATATGVRRQGGSTLTMQLARWMYSINSQTVRGKLQQIAAALWLEARYSKRDILEMYLNVVPYGGNIEGVGAASLIYFGKRAADLTTAEALTLAVIPQNPRARGLPHAANNSALAQARARMLARWLEAYPQERERSLEPPPTRTLAQLPFRAPHLTDQLLALQQRPREIWTHLNPRMQSTLERSLAQYLERVRMMGIRNASALLVDARTMQVKALVGSANFFNADIAGQVNGVLAKRSPGSTLKPFIYALALDQGLLHPMTVLKDAPTAFGPFSPENFDGRFVGPITAQEALVRSRNVPAVAVAAQLAQPSLYDWLRSAGVQSMASESHYGLALALGGGELTLEETARLYAVLASGGVLRPLRYTRNEDAAQGTRVLSEQAAFITLAMLHTNPRPDTGAPARPTVAWKTGTSWGFRDAWTAGVFDHHVLVVWVGNFDGASNPALVGVQTAAPLFFLMVDALRSQALVERIEESEPPPGLTRVQVCRDSGDLPNLDCPERTTTWFIPGKSPIRLSTLHRRVLIDTRTDKVVCIESPTTRWQVREFWTPDMLRLFRDAGLPRRPPPAMPACATSMDDERSAPRILTPHKGLTYTLRLSQPVPLALNANSASGKQYWFADQTFIGETLAGQALAWLPPRADRYTLRVLDESGRADRRELHVEVVP